MTGAATASTILFIRGSVAAAASRTPGRAYPARARARLAESRWRRRSRRGRRCGGGRPSKRAALHVAARQNGFARKNYYGPDDTRRETYGHSHTRRDQTSNYEK